MLIRVNNNNELRVSLSGDTSLPVEVLFYRFFSEQRFPPPPP